MNQSSHARTQNLSVAVLELTPDPTETDPRWRLAQSVVAGPQFVRSALLSRFLLYVVTESIEGRQTEISEHKIGVAVFGRPPLYRTDEDNIVRNYARQLRKRLAEHFAGEGRDEAMRIEIPVGSYVPSFPLRTASPADGILAEERGRAGIGEALAAGRTSRFRAIRPTGRLLAGIFVATLIAAACGYWGVAKVRAADPLHDFWNAVLPQKGNTFVIPPDAGFNLMEDMSRRAVPLALYIRGTYDMPASVLDTHAGRDLRSEQYTDFISLQIVTSLAHQPQYDPQHVLLRFPRDLRLDDLKYANAVIIGSVSANPWASLAEGKTNFRIVPSADMESATIVNSHPLPGEDKSYVSHWNEPAHETFGLIQFLPNLGGSGHLLFIQGLDAAGTEAASELLFHPDSIAPILKRTRRPDGTFRSFEILLRATSIQSNAEGTVILGSRIQ